MRISVVRIQGAVAGVQITFAVEVIAAALAEGLEDHRSLGVFGAVGGHQNFDFRDHVLVDVGDLRAGVAGIYQVGAIKHVSHCTVRLSSVGGVRSDRAVVGANDFIVKSGALGQAVGQSHSRHDLQQFASVAADDGNIFDHFACSGSC